MVPRDDGYKIVVIGVERVDKEDEALHTFHVECPVCCKF